MSEKTDTTELLACPFCGNADRPRLADFEGEPYVPGYVIVCDAYGFDGDPANGCGAGSGWAETPEDAAAQWNRRRAHTPSSEQATS